MKQLRETVKRRLPFLTPIYGQSLYLLRYLKWRFSPEGTVSRIRILSHKDKHVGERCFIIGNGPSLKKMDLSPLRNEFTFGLNRIYLLFPEMGFHTTYYVTINPNVVEQFASEIETLPMPKFIGWQKDQHLRFTDDMIFLPPSPTGLGFTTQVARAMPEGWTVTYTAMQIAHYMGFKEVYLIGVDHNFATQGKANQLVVSQGDDQNHFHPNYFGKGIKWELPDLEGSERAYLLAKKVYEQSGRKIFDATVGGKLNIYPKVDYSTLFS